jgi:hypothetical protein
MPNGLYKPSHLFGVIHEPISCKYDYVGYDMTSLISTYFYSSHHASASCSQFKRYSTLMDMLLTSDKKQPHMLHGMKIHYDQHKYSQLCFTYANHCGSVVDSFNFSKYANAVADCRSSPIKV